MIGLSKEQVLACMGAPAKQAATGATEVWSYDSGNSAAGINSVRNCTVNVVMTAGRVSSLNYVGDTGGLITQGEQSAFAPGGRYMVAATALIPRHLEHGVPEKAAPGFVATII
jgi:hypothetical protein